MQLLYYSELTLFFQYKTEIFNLGVLNYQLIADKLLKFFALNQFLSANKQNKGGSLVISAEYQFCLSLYCCTRLPL